MHILGLIWGILAVIGMVIGFFPCLGALNWLNIPFAGIGLIISAIATASANEQTKNTATTALILNGIAVAVGIFRLILGGGVV